MGLLLWIIDIKGLSAWSEPLRVFGINPLFLYVLSEVLAITLGLQLAHTPSGEPASVSSRIYDTVFLPVAGKLNGSLLYAIVFMLVCWFAGWILCKKRIIIKL